VTATLILKVYTINYILSLNLFFRYNSGGKQFSPVPTKHFSVQCDAVTIHSVYWATRKVSQPVTNVTQMGAAVSAGGGQGFMQSPVTPGNNQANNNNTLGRR
jgi:hypothetical protein